MIAKLICCLLVALTVQAQASRSCLSSHLREAIEVNVDRMNIYSQLSGGTSQKLSKKLIRYEKLVLFTLPLTGLEKRALALQAQGIPFLCEDFKVSKNQGLPIRQSSSPVLADFKALDVSAAKESLAVLINQENLSAVHAEALRLIESLDSEIRFNCMTRHVLESIARVSKLGIKYDLMSQKLNLSEKPSLESLKLLKLEIKALWGSAQLDEMAVPLQAEGLPILCHDLPVVQFTGDF